jgi:hypothetical protein
LLTVFVQGAAAIPAYPDEPPESVSAEVDRVLRSDLNYRRTFAFGPKYDAHMTKGAISRGLLADLHVLAEAGEIDSAGSFASEAAAFLRRIQAAEVPEAEMLRLRRISQSTREVEFAIATCFALYSAGRCAN